MKKILISFFMLMACLKTGIAQIEVHGWLKNYDDPVLTIFKPFNGKAMPLNHEKIAVNNKGEFYINLPETLPGFLLLLTGPDESIKIYAEPGMPDSVFADVNALDETLQFKGQNHAQNRFLNTLKRESDFTGFGNTLTEIALKYDTLPGIIYNNVLKMREDELDALRVESDKFQFSKSFVEAVTADIHFYHVNLFMGICISEFAPSTRGKPSRFDENWGRYWDQMMHYQDISDEKAFVSIWYWMYAYRYVNTYQGWYHDNKFIKNPDWEKGEHLVNEDSLTRQYFKGKSLEYALAALIVYEAGKTQFHFLLTEVFEKFKMSYPESEYLPVLEKAIKPVYQYYETQKEPLPDGIFFVENSEDINALSTLYERFSGKTIFVDIWATWCGPCKREFAYKKDLDIFLKENDVIPLYISIDKPEREEKWKEMIKYYDLKGYHIRTNETLLADVYSYFGRNGNLSIPVYAIIGKDGLTLQSDAKRPSQGIELIEHIRKGLKKG